MRRISRWDSSFIHRYIYFIITISFSLHRRAFAKANAPLSESLMTLRSVCCCRKRWMKRNCNTIVSWSRSDRMLHGSQMPRQTLQLQKNQQQLLNLLQPISCSSSIVSYNIVSFEYSPLSSPYHLSQVNASVARNELHGSVTTKTANSSARAMLARWLQLLLYRPA